MFRFSILIGWDSLNFYRISGIIIYFYVIVKVFFFFFLRFYATTRIHCANAIHFLPVFVKKLSHYSVQFCPGKQWKKKNLGWSVLLACKVNFFSHYKRETGHTFHAVLDNKPLHNLPKTTRNRHYESCDSLLVTMLQYKPILILLAKTLVL